MTFVHPDDAFEAEGDLRSLFFPRMSRPKGWHDLRIEANNREDRFAIDHRIVFVPTGQVWAVLDSEYCPQKKWTGRRMPPDWSLNLARQVIRGGLVSPKYQTFKDDPDKFFFVRMRHDCRAAGIVHGWELQASNIHEPSDSFHVTNTESVVGIRQGHADFVKVPSENAVFACLDDGTAEELEYFVMQRLQFVVHKLSEESLR